MENQRNKTTMNSNPPESTPSSSEAGPEHTLVTRVVHMTTTYRRTITRTTPKKKNRTKSSTSPEKATPAEPTLPTEALQQLLPDKPEENNSEPGATALPSEINWEPASLPSEQATPTEPTLPTEALQQLLPDKPEENNLEPAVQGATALTSEENNSEPASTALPSEINWEPAVQGALPSKEYNPGTNAQGATALPSEEYNSHPAAPASDHSWYDDSSSMETHPPSEAASEHDGASFNFPDEQRGHSENPENGLEDEHSSSIPMNRSGLFWVPLENQVQADSEPEPPSKSKDKIFPSWIPLEDEVEEPPLEEIGGEEAREPRGFPEEWIPWNNPEDEEQEPQQEEVGDAEEEPRAFPEEWIPWNQPEDVQPLQQSPQRKRSLQEELPSPPETPPRKRNKSLPEGWIPWSDKNDSSSSSEEDEEGLPRITEIKEEPEEHDQHEEAETISEEGEQQLPRTPEENRRQIKEEPDEYEDEEAKIKSEEQQLPRTPEENRLQIKEEPEEIKEKSPASSGGWSWPSTEQEDEELELVSSANKEGELPEGWISWIDNSSNGSPSAEEPSGQEGKDVLPPVEEESSSDGEEEEDDGEDEKEASQNDQDDSPTLSDQDESSKLNTGFENKDEHSSDSGLSTIHEENSGDLSLDDETDTSSSNAALLPTGEEQSDTISDEELQRINAALAKLKIDSASPSSSNSTSSSSSSSAISETSGTTLPLEKISPSSSSSNDTSSGTSTSNSSASGTNDEPESTDESEKTDKDKIGNEEANAEEDPIADLINAAMLRMQMGSEEEPEPEEKPEEEVIKKAIQSAAQDKKRQGQIDSVLRLLHLSNNQALLIEKAMEDALRRGLNKETRAESSVQPFPTYIPWMPNGLETGKYLALDLGGTNFRVMFITLVPGAEPKIDSQKFAVPTELMTGSGEDLFDFIAESIKLFCRRGQATLEMYISLAFTFSFPVDQQALDAGVLSRWTKGFDLSDVVGKDICQLLRDALKRAGSEVDNINVVAVLNDTTGVFLSSAWREPRCRVGLILGTGTNACYLEKKSDAQDIAPNEGNNDHDHVVLNTEWGTFGEKGELDFVATRWDRFLDENSTHPGMHIYEKMTSGLYLGELVRLVLKELTLEGLVFTEVDSLKILAQKDSFDTRHLCMVESDPVGQYAECREALKEVLGGINGLSDKDCYTVRQVCEEVSRRACMMLGAGIAGLLTKMDYKDVVIAVDGTVFRCHHLFEVLMTKKIAQLMGAKFKFKLRISVEGSGIGAAVAAALAEEKSGKI